MFRNFLILTASDNAASTLSAIRFLRIIAVLIGGLTAGGTSAHAYTLGGMGATTCKFYNDSGRESYDQGPTLSLSAQQFQVFSSGNAWIIGFLAGIGFVNQNGDDPLAGVDVVGMVHWVQHYCQDHPGENLGQAAAAFYYLHPHN